MNRQNAGRNFWLSNGLSERLSRLLSKLVWRDGAMTPTRSALTLLTDHVAQLSRRREGRFALERFARAGLDLAGAVDLSGLVAQCAPSGGARRRDVFECLVPLAPSDEVAAQCAVAALRPELTRIARLLARGSLERDEAHSEMVAIGLDVVTRAKCGGWKVPEPERVINAIWTETRRSAGMRRRGLFDVVPLSEDLDVPVADPDRLERWPGLLGAAVARRVLTPRQVVLIAQTRMDGRPLVDVARDLGRPYDAVRKERQRAETALREFALGSVRRCEP